MSCFVQRGHISETMILQNKMCGYLNSSISCKSYEEPGSLHLIISIDLSLGDTACYYFKLQKNMGGYKWHCTCVEKVIPHVYMYNLKSIRWLYINNILTECRMACITHINVIQKDQNSISSTVKNITALYPLQL